MSATLVQMAAKIARSVPTASLGEIYEALQDQYLRIHSGYQWPWLSTETKLHVPALYGEGTVSIVDQTTALVGTGTTWNTGWTGRKILFGPNGQDYVIAAFLSPTTATLAQAVNFGANQTDLSYTIYQDTYQMPSDYEPGADISLVNCQLRSQIVKVPRPTLEERAVQEKYTFTNNPLVYADAGYDDTTGRYLIKFSPPPGTTGEYSFFYRRRPPALEALASIPLVPESFLQAVELFAESSVRMSNGIHGWEEAYTAASKIVYSLRRQVVTSSVVNAPGFQTGALPSDSSISDGGLSILPGWRG